MMEYYLDFHEIERTSCRVMWTFVVFNKKIKFNVSLLLKITEVEGHLFCNLLSASSFMLLYMRFEGPSFNFLDILSISVDLSHVFIMISLLSHESDGGCDH
jgi:hypothetical protein